MPTPRLARRCPSCGSRVQPGSEACAICGQAVPWRWTRRGVLLESGLIVAAVAFLGLALAWARGTGRHFLSPAERVARVEVIDRVPTEVPTFTPTPDPLRAEGAAGAAAGTSITTTEGLQGQAPMPSESAASQASASEGEPPTAAADATRAPETTPTPAPTVEVGGAQAAGEQAAGEPIVVVEAQTHVVKSGDTLGGIAARYGVTLDDLLQLNADWLASVNQTLQVGDAVVVKGAEAVTATAPPVAASVAPPALVGGSTVAGSSVAGPEDYSPAAELWPRSPAVLSPGPNAVVTAHEVLLRWASVGVLPRGVAYVVSVRDAEAPAGEVELTWVNTNATALRIPSDYRPALGSSRKILWTVDVRRRGGRVADRQGVLLCPEPTPSAFTWSPGG